MGAYDNPQIIIPPNYAEIFMRNFEAGKAQVEAAKQRAEDRRNKIKAEQQRLDDRTLAFDLQRMEINAGDLTQSLQQQTTFLADDYAENERLYSENKISREVYNANRISAYRKLNEMKALGGILNQQSKEIQNVDLSKYQGEATNGVGLINAWKQGKIKFQYVGDEIEMYYPDEAGNMQIVDTNSLQEGEFFNINERFDLSNNRLKIIAGGKEYEARHRAGESITIGNTTKTFTEDQYDKVLTNDQFKEQEIKKFTNNDEMLEAVRNKKDGGSLYHDMILNKLIQLDENGNPKRDEKNNVIFTETGNKLLERSFKYDESGKEMEPSKEQIDLVKEQINSLQYTDNNREILDKITKRYIAEQAWETVKGNLKTVSTEATETKTGTGTGTEASNYVDSTYSTQLSPDKRRKLTSFLEDWNAQKWQGKNTKEILESIKGQDASVFGANAGDIANKQFLTLPELNAEIQKIKNGEESFILQSSGYPLKDDQIKKLEEYIGANAGKNTIIEMGIKQRKDKTQFYTMFDRNDLVFNELDGNSDNPSDIIQIIQTLPAYVGVDTNILNKEITRLLNK